MTRLYLVSRLAGIESASAVAAFSIGDVAIGAGQIKYGDVMIFAGRTTEGAGRPAPQRTSEVPLIRLEAARCYQHQRLRLWRPPDERQR